MSVLPYSPIPWVRRLKNFYPKGLKMGSKVKSYSKGSCKKEILEIEPKMRNLEQF